VQPIPGDKLISNAHEPVSVRECVEFATVAGDLSQLSMQFRPVQQCGERFTQPLHTREIGWILVRRNIFDPNKPVDSDAEIHSVSGGPPLPNEWSH
jgi:hypothetical protein